MLEDTALIFRYLLKGCRILCVGCGIPGMQYVQPPPSGQQIRVADHLDPPA
jgi:hypothetical protein